LCYFNTLRRHANAGGGQDTPPPGKIFRGRACGSDIIQRGTTSPSFWPSEASAIHNPCLGFPEVVMDFGIAPSARPGMTAESSVLYRRYAAAEVNVSATPFMQ
jgi:hypothetical protein